MILVRDYENMQKNYQALLDKRLNAHVAENLEKRQKGEQFRVLDPANLPQNPDNPNRLLIMIVGLLGGCGLGVGLAVGLEQLNPTFKRREEVETLPGIRVLAVIPDFFTMNLGIQGSGAGQMLARQRPMRFSLARGTTNWDVSIVDYFGKSRGSLPPHPQSCRQVAAMVRSLPNNTVWPHRDWSCPPRDAAQPIIEVTSALKGEGKTTTVVNLGYTLARDLGKRTLLIDCDFRCPALHHYVNVPAPAGLFELLDGQASLEDCLSAIDEVPCSIMSVGGSGGEENELTRIQQLSALCRNYGGILSLSLINTPPVLSSATMGILASLADVLIMVIRAGTTPKHVVQQAFTMLGLTTEALVILNAVELQRMPYYMYGYSMSYGGERSIETAAK